MRAKRDGRSSGTVCSINRRKHEGMAENQYLRPAVTGKLLTWKDCFKVGMLSSMISMGLLLCGSDGDDT